MQHVRSHNQFKKCAITNFTAGQPIDTRVTKWRAQRTFESFLQHPSADWKSLVDKNLLWKVFSTSRWLRNSNWAVSHLDLDYKAWEFWFLHAMHVNVRLFLQDFAFIYIISSEGSENLIHEWLLLFISKSLVDWLFVLSHNLLVVKGRPKCMTVTDPTPPT